jgi:hypothetical protein
VRKLPPTDPGSDVLKRLMTCPCEPSVQEFVVEDVGQFFRIKQVP